MFSQVMCWIDWSRFSGDSRRAAAQAIASRLEVIP